MHLSLFPSRPILLREKGVGEKHINALEGEVVRLGNTLEFFNKSRGICKIGHQSFFLFKRAYLVRRGHLVPWPSHQLW